MIKIFFNICFILFLIIIDQTKTIAQENNPDSLSVKKDTVVISNKARSIIDSINAKPLDEFIENTPVPQKKYIMTKSPLKAVLFSLVLPGLGQYYVESYWKVPIFLGASGVLIYLYIDNNNTYNKLQKEWDVMSDTDPNKMLWKARKEVYRDNRDQTAFYLAGVYILCTIDAYVGAHLYDFNVTDDLSLQLSPDPVNLFRVGFSYKW